MEEPFEREKKRLIRQMGQNRDLRTSSLHWLTDASRYKYSYNFTWLGRPIIQFPQDIVAIQEVLWMVKPDLVIETGIAHGGSLILSASLLELIGGDGKVLGIDREIRAHNRVAIESHPLVKRIHMIEGSSTDPQVCRRVYDFARESARVCLFLDSLHTHAHVLAELEAYAPLVRKGCYIIVFDTIIEQLPKDFFPDRPWARGNNPCTALREFLIANDRFEIDRELNDKLLITSTPRGYLRCIRDPA